MLQTTDYREFNRMAAGSQISALHTDKDIYRNNTDISFSEFKRRIDPRYTYAKFHALLDSYLEQVELYIRTEGREGIKRLMVFMPPRHTKTTNVSRRFPAWFIGRNPDKRMIMASYGANLANRNSRFVRNTIKSDRYIEMFPGAALAQDTASVQEWDIAGHDGGAIAAGIGGGITGHGAHLMVIDDPIKSRAEAESPTYREALKEWWGDVYTRLEEPGSAVILMHTRWHEDDLAGWLLSEQPGEWVVLRLPALAETQEERDEFAKKYGLSLGEPDPLGREPGEPLWEGKYGLPELEDRRQKLGDYRFSAEYQQSPKSKSGRLFDTQLVHIVDIAPECDRVVRFYDLAVTKNKTSDYTAGGKVGVTSAGDVVVFDVWRRQLTAPDIQEGIVQNATIDGTTVPIRLEADKAGIVELAYLLRDERMHSYIIDAVPPVGDKYTRAGPVAVRVKAGKMYILKAAWNREFLDELAMFPQGAHDDQVDMLSGAWDMLVASSQIKIASTADSEIEIETEDDLAKLMLQTSAEYEAWLNSAERLNENDSYWERPGW